MGTSTNWLNQDFCPLSIFAMAVILCCDLLCFLSSSHAASDACEVLTLYFSVLRLSRLCGT
jgi:hypothetical protein